MPSIRTAPFYALFLASLLTGVGAYGDPVLLFPYFDSNGENGVFLAWSDDGREFHHVNQGKPVLTPPDWRNQNLTRDPSIVLNDGVFHMVWTSNWEGRYFGYASSTDLRTWSEPKMVQPFASSTEQPRNVWAPEIFRDPVAGDFKVVWSSTLPSELNDGDGSEDSHGNDHRMYYVSTTDFESFSQPKLIYNDDTCSTIDAHIAFDQGDADNSADDRWIMALKKEVPAEQDGKNIRLAFSPPQIGPASFGKPTPAIVGMGTNIQGKQFAEGPALVRWNGEWLLYWDSYTARHYSLATSTDLQTWTDESDQLKLPARHPRHGTVFAAERDAVGWELKSTTE